MRGTSPKCVEHVRSWSGIWFWNVLIWNCVLECPPKHIFKSGTYNKCPINDSFDCSMSEHMKRLWLQPVDLNSDGKSWPSYNTYHFVRPCVRSSCFGDYVNMLMGVKCHPLLCQYLICKHTTFSSSWPAGASIFSTQLSGLLRQKSFLFYYQLGVRGHFRPSSCVAQFKQRIFSIWLAFTFSENGWVVHVFNDLFHQLDDTEIMRVSLLYMLKHGFCGKYTRQPVTKEILALISNLNVFNRYIVTYIFYITSNDTYTY